MILYPSSRSTDEIEFKLNSDDFLKGHIHKISKYLRSKGMKYKYYRRYDRKKLMSWGYYRIERKNEYITWEDNTRLAEEIVKAALGE